MCGLLVCFEHSGAHANKHWSTMLISDLEKMTEEVAQGGQMITKIRNGFKSRVSTLKNDEGGFVFFVPLFYILAAFGVFGMAAAG